MDKITEQKRINPFFEDYGTPHYTIPFPKIKTSDYEEAFMEGIRRDDVFQPFFRACQVRKPMMNLTH